MKCSRCSSRHVGHLGQPTANLTCPFLTLSAMSASGEVGRSTSIHHQGGWGPRYGERPPICFAAPATSRRAYSFTSTSTFSSTVKAKTTAISFRLGLSFEVSKRVLMRLLSSVSYLLRQALGPCPCGSRDSTYYSMETTSRCWSWERVGSTDQAQLR
jgi:hypothetical protein